MRAIAHIVAVRGVLSYNRAAANRPLTRLRFSSRDVAWVPLSLVPVWLSVPLRGPNAAAIHLILRRNM
jgi:hypothetical protein